MKYGDVLVSSQQGVNSIDVLTKYGEMDINRLASVLGVSVNRLKDICEGDGFLVGESADSLAQLFLMFFSI